MHVSVMIHGRPKVESFHAMIFPSRAEVGGNIDEDLRANRGNRMGKEVEFFSERALIRRYVGI